MPEKFDIYSKTFFRDVGNFFRYLCELVLRHQMWVSNYFVNSFYSASEFLFLLSFAVICRFSPMLGKFSESQTAFVTTFTIAGSFLKTVTNFLKRVFAEGFSELVSGFIKVVGVAGTFVKYRGSESDSNRT